MSPHKGVLSPAPPLEDFSHPGVRVFNIYAKNDNEMCLARTRSREIPSSFNSSECQAEAAFTVTHAFSPVKQPPPQEMTRNRWSGSLLGSSGSTGNACGLLSHCIMMSLNKRLSDKPSVRAEKGKV